LIYTSGTTGVHKGVMLSYHNLLFAARTSGLLCAMVPNDRVCAVLPMSHIVGLSIGLVSTLTFGATNVTIPKYDPAHLAQSLASEGITILSGVPATYQRLLACKSTAGLSHIDRGRLRLIGVAGAPLDPALKKRVELELGLPLLNTFGITECAPGISGVRNDDPQSDDTAGRILPGIETRLIRADGPTASDGEIGELHVRGPNIMLGYYKAQDLTDKAADRDGWVAAGDLARFSRRYLYIVGRSKEMIIRSGFNVDPAEVEAVIFERPAVLQSAVVGRSVEGNEVVVAVVQLLPGAAVTSKEPSAFVAPLVTAYKRPSRFVVLVTFPAGSTGKILKHKLKELAATI
jgi:long-chain acyl-CoA synthetase